MINTTWDIGEGFIRIRARDENSQEIGSVMVERDGDEILTSLKVEGWDWNGAAIEYNEPGRDQEFQEAIRQLHARIEAIKSLQDDIPVVFKALTESRVKFRE